MDEIVKHINDTNASFRTLGAGDAKNTDLFLDNEHYELFKDLGEQITVRFNKENLSKAILFIASILPRKYDNSSVHKTVSYSYEFVYDQLSLLEYYFMVDGSPVTTKTQIWNARKDVPKKNGEIDSRFYFNGLIEEVEYINSKGDHVPAKFTIRNYLAGGYSDLHIKRATDGIFDVWVTNVQEPYSDDKEDGLEIEEESSHKNFFLQQIFYGAPGTGKSNTIKREVEDQDRIHFRTTFHPDSDYSTFVGCYKPTMKSVKKTVVIGQDEKEVKPLTGGTDSVEQISYQFVPQAFTKAYCEAWNHYIENEESEPVYLIIEEINRGNCAQIFGDIFQLLDRKNGFSEYPIDADEDLKKFLMNGTKDDGTSWLVNKKGIENGQLCLPANLHIWATMNTSDQSLFPIDSAFKRRWDWKYIPIDYNKETWSIVAKGASYSWSDFLKKMNNLVASTTDSEDKMLGFYFAKAKDGIIDADTFVGKVVFYLWNDVFKDYGLPKEILNGAESKEFAFRNFFNVDGSANEDVVKRLLDNLEIKIAGSNENETYIENDDIDAGKAEHKETLVAVTINGERLTADDITQFDLYLNAIKKIGVNRIGPALEAMKYRRKGSPMATKDPVQSLLESDNYSYVKVDGYYFVKGANGYTLVRILEDLNTSLNLNIQIEYR